MKSAGQRMNKGEESDVHEEIDALRSSLKELRGDLVELVSHALGLGRGGALAARETAGDAVEQLKARISDLKGRGGARVAAVERRMEERPMSSALIAFGIGFAAALLFSRR